MAKLLTDAAYKKKKGCVCPSCGGDQIEGDSVEIDAGEATQEISCLDCGATWTDLYKLAGFFNFSAGQS